MGLATRILQHSEFASNHLKIEGGIPVFVDNAAFEADFAEAKRLKLDLDWRELRDSNSSDKCSPQLKSKFANNTRQRLFWRAQGSNMILTGLRLTDEEA